MGRGGGARPHLLHVSLVKYAAVDLCLKEDSQFWAQQKSNLILIKKIKIII